MEEKSPAMPLVVFLEYLKITASGSDSQGKFEYAECVERENARYPHCGGEELYAHGYYGEGRDAARRQLRLKVKKYRCRCCGKCFSQSFGHIVV